MHSFVSCIADFFVRNNRFLQSFRHRTRMIALKKQKENKVQKIAEKFVYSPKIIEKNFIFPYKNYGNPPKRVL